MLLFFRLFFIARAYASAKKWTEAIALYQRTLDYAKTALEGYKKLKSKDVQYQVQMFSMCSVRIFQFWNDRTLLHVKPFSSKCTTMQWICCLLSILFEIICIIWYWNAIALIRITFAVDWALKDNYLSLETPDRNCQWYQHLLTLFAIFYESNTEGTNFQMMLICVTLRLYYVHVLYCIQLV